MVNLDDFSKTEKTRVLLNFPPSSNSIVLVDGKRLLVLDILALYLFLQAKVTIT